MRSEKLCVLLVATAASFSASCGKDVSYGDSPEYLTQQGPGDTPGSGPGDGSGNGNGSGSGNGSGNGDGGWNGHDCGSQNQVSWSFIQPQPTVNRSVDLLLVVDTSSSLDQERARIATTLPAFVSQLPAGTDYRVAVMLAHGGASYYSGRLYSSHGNPAVLNSATQSPASIQAALEATLRAPLGDVDEANGEAMMYSLLSSQEPARLAQIKSQGFFRENASLSVLFISDENDVCYPPQLHGYSHFPDYVPSVGGVEEIAYQRYCLKPNHSVAVTPERVVSELQRLKGAEKLSFGALIHKDPAQVPAGGEDSIGHGLLELIQGQPDGMSFEIAENNYVPGLTQLGSIVSSQLLLRTAFTLDGSAGVVAASLRIQVDGHAVSGTYDAGSRVVRIAKTDAGHAGSAVLVTACRL
jgi:hypothetical protein